MFDIRDLKPEDLIGVELLGVVVDIDDPLTKGRVRARVDVLHDDMADSDIPWARCTSSIAGLNVPLLGSKIGIEFLGGDRNNPVYSYQALRTEDISGTPLSEDYPHTRGFYDGVNYILLNRQQRKITIHTPQNTITLDASGLSVNTQGSLDAIVSGDLSAAVSGSASLAAASIDASASGPVSIQGNPILLN